MLFCAGMRASQRCSLAWSMATFWMVRPPSDHAVHQNAADPEGRAAGLVGFARHRLTDETLGGPPSEIPRNKRVKRTLLHLTGPAVGPEME